MDEIIERIENELRGWGWLVRSNAHDTQARGEYFANITSPEFKASLGQDGTSFPTYADTPAQALSDALDAAYLGRQS